MRPLNVWENEPEENLGELLFRAPVLKEDDSKVGKANMWYQSRPVQGPTKNDGPSRIGGGRSLSRRVSGETQLDLSEEEDVPPTSH